MSACRMVFILCKKLFVVINHIAKPELGQVQIPHRIFIFCIYAEQCLNQLQEQPVYIIYIR